MSLAMVLHEMATNAAQYGALSTRDGQVCVRWRVGEAGDSLTIEWTESGGPAATEPSSIGFGGTLIQATVNYSLSGKVELNYGDDGLEGLIVIPLGGAALPD